MRILLVVFFLTPLLLAGETIEAFDRTWEVQQASDWSFDDEILRLVVPGEPPPGVPRRPQKYAIAETHALPESDGGGRGPARRAEPYLYLRVAG